LAYPKGTLAKIVMRHPNRHAANPHTPHIRLEEDRVIHAEPLGGSMHRLGGLWSEGYFYHFVIKFTKLALRTILSLNDISRKDRVHLRNHFVNINV